jgi:hypothetical protein
MKFRSKIWSLPISVGAAFGVVLVLILVMGVQNNRNLELLRTVETPFLGNYSAPLEQMSDNS